MKMVTTIGKSPDQPTKDSRCQALIVDKVAGGPETETAALADVQLPDGSRKALPPSARDALAVFEDLCLLANSEKPRFLQLDYLHKTFALELIESVLTNYHDLFRKVRCIVPRPSSSPRTSVM